MALFLHEITRYINGQTSDNGWWEIRGSKLYNRCGGWHDYVPSPDDEIRESTWDEIMRETVRDDAQITGWIAPDGTFYGCAPEDHSLLARYVLGASERELEKRGYAKIFSVPSYVRHSEPYECVRSDLRRLTDEQLQVLRDKGIDHMDFYV